MTHVDDEFEFQLTETVEDLMARGWSEADARREAARRFGNRRKYRQQIIRIDRRTERGRRWTTLAEGLRLNARDAGRSLRRSPLVSLAAVLTLALGVGANSAVFSILNALQWQALPVTAPERLVAMMPDAARTTWTGPQWDVIQANPALAAGTMAFAGARFNLSGSGETDVVDGLFVSGTFFDVLGVRPSMGRGIEPSDDTPLASGERAAIIGFQFWQRRFGGTANAIGRTIAIERVPFTIVGVAPEGFNGPEVGRTFDIAVPLRAEPAIRGRASYLSQAGTWWLSILSRLKAGETLDQKVAVWNGLRPGVREATMPADMRPANRERYLRQPFAAEPAATGTSILRDRYRDPLVVMLAGVALVVLVACVNVANLLLARVPARRRELSIRMSLGATRASLVRQLILEGCAVALAGGGCALAVAAWGSAFLVHQFSTYSATVVLDVGIDWRVLTFTSALAAVVTIVCAAGPALGALDVSPSAALTVTTRGHVGEQGRRLTSTLLAGQLAVSVVAVVAACIFVATFTRLVTRDTGFDRRDVLIATLNASRSRVPSADRAALLDRLRARVERLPGVESAAVSPVTPTSGDWAFSAYVPAARWVAEDDRHTFVNLVTAHWFKTYGTRLIAGRDFTDTDAPGAPAVVIVNHSFVRRYIGAGVAVGQTVEYRDGASRGAKLAHIVGVAQDAVYRSLREQIPPVMYFPMAQRPDDPLTGAALSVRARPGQMATLGPTLARAIAETDPDLTFSFRSLETQIDATLTHERILAIFSGFVGGLVLLLVSVGVYGVTTSVVSQRRTEYSLRLALGATRADVLRMVIGRVAPVLLVGITAGAAASIGLSRYVHALVYGVEPSDPRILIGVAALLAVVSCCAAMTPARRAASLDPAEVLREG